MTTWNCVAEIATARDMDSTPVECGVARAAGMLDCPQCGTQRAPFRENGEGAIFDIVETSAPRFDGDPEALGVKVRDTAVSGTNEVSERTEDDHAEDQ